MVGKSVAVAFLVIALAACSPRLQPSDLASLASAAPALLQDPLQAGDIPASKWPAAIARLKPDRVYATPDGLYIATSSFFVQEWGLFVPRSGFTPQQGTDPSYTSIGQGIFSYHVKG